MTLKKITIYVASLFAISSIAGCLLSPNDTLGKKDIPNHLKLKALKEKILDVKEIDDLRCKKDDPNDCSSYGKIKQYSYISDKIVERQTLNIEGMLGSEGGEIEEDLSKRTENSVTFPLGNNEFNTIFYTSDAFAKVNNEWYYIEYATTTIDAFNTQIEKESESATTSGMILGEFFGADYPATDDQSIVNTTTNWQTSHDATSGTLRGGTVYYIQSYNYTAGDFANERGFLKADTSGIPDNATISAASLVLNSVEKKDSAGAGLGDTSAYNVYNSSHSDTLTTTDYNDGGTTAWSTAVTWTNWPATANADVTYTFNATGIAGISKTGYTKLCLREATYDVANSVPATSKKQTYVAPNNSAATGTGDDPYLSITYTVPTTYAGSVIIFE